MNSRGVKTLPTWDYPKNLAPIVTPKKVTPVTQPPVKKSAFGEDVIPTNAKKVTRATSTKLQKANLAPGRVGQGGRFKKHLGR